MKILVFLTILFRSSLVNGNSTNSNHTNNRFPKDFKFGVSTAAYQIEGAWAEDGKGMSVWDYMIHTGTIKIHDGSNADVAADSYHLYEKDIEILEELGVQSYKFSISWPRVLPNGLKTYVNPKGIAYYNALIDGLIAKGIEPVVGMYHWDLPQNLQDKGGVLSDDFPTWFGDYARILYQNFGDRVKFWIPINEPIIHCHSTYEMANYPPKIAMHGVGFYACVRNYLLAHARAYHIYNDEFRSSQKGNVSVNHFVIYPIPKTNSTEDLEAVKDYMAFRTGILLDPILSKTGNYPQRIIDRVALLSTQQGLNSSRLKPFTDEEVTYIRGTTDYLTLNHYYTEIVYRATKKTKVSPSFDEDENVMTYDWRPKISTAAGSISTTTHYAPGFYSTLHYMHDTYDHPEIYIIENGFYNLGKNDSMEYLRVNALRNYLQAMLNAMEDGVRVRGYFYWSLIDNFQWTAGYTARFGLYAVNMSDPARTRTPRKTALVYKDIIKSRAIDYSYDPESNAGTLVRQSIISIVILMSIIKLL